MWPNLKLFCETCRKQNFSVNDICKKSCTVLMNSFIFTGTVSKECKEPCHLPKNWHKFRIERHISRNIRNDFDWNFYLKCERQKYVIDKHKHRGVVTTITENKWKMETCESVYDNVENTGRMHREHIYTCHCI